MEWSEEWNLEESWVTNLTQADAEIIIYVESSSLVQRA
jgi:hypothetical protein